jgi:uncharacterized protein (DUF2141 family)
MNTLRKFTLATTLFAAAATFAHASELRLTVNDIGVNEGIINVAVFNTEESYNGGKPVAVKSVAVTANTLSTDFTELADGHYAIKIMHDENSNGKLDTNFIGIPTEGYGFSNNGGRFGPASYSDAKFSVTGNTEITIKLR